MGWPGAGQAGRPVSRQGPGYFPGRVGEGRACWSLGNAYVSMGSPAQALTFAKKHLEISQEVSRPFPPQPQPPALASASVARSPTTAGAASLPQAGQGPLCAPGSLRPAGLSLLPWLLPRAARGPTPIAFCGSLGLGGSTGVCFLPLEFGVALGQWVLLSPAERGQLGHQTPVPDPRGILGARGPGRPWESSPGTPPPDPFLGKMDRDAPAAVRAARRWAPQCRQG